MFNKDMKILKNKQMNNTIAELKNTLWKKKKKKNTLCIVH